MHELYTVLQICVGTRRLRFIRLLTIACAAFCSSTPLVRLWSSPEPHCDSYQTRLRFTEHNLPILPSRLLTLICAFIHCRPRLWSRSTALHGTFCSLSIFLLLSCRSLPMRMAPFTSHGQSASRVPVLAASSRPPRARYFTLRYPTRPTLVPRALVSSVHLDSLVCRGCSGLALVADLHMTRALH